MLNKIINWQKTKLGKLVMALICLGLGYLFASISINNGNLGDYLITLIFLVFFLKFCFRLIGDFIHGLIK